MPKFQTKTIYEALGREPVHPFPARMAPGIALAAMPENSPQLRVLDPMMGSGTVLTMARKRGHRAFGFDLDPLAVELDREQRILAKEVRNKWTNWMLPTELQSTKLAIANESPDQVFWFRYVISKLPGELK